MDRSTRSGRVAVLGVGLLLVLVFAGLAAAQYPSRERLSAPAGGGGAATSLAPGATGSDLTLSGDLSAAHVLVTGTTVPPASGQLVSVGGLGAASGAIWGPVATPGSSNYALFLTTSNQYFNAPAGGSVNMSVNDGAALWSCNVSGCKASESTNHGVVTLDGTGTGSVTIVSGTVCSCSYKTAGILIPTCSSSGNTLTIAGGTAGADLNYVCL